MKAGTAAKRRAARMAADAAQRVLRYFEKERPKDPRPRAAIKAIRTWSGGALDLGMRQVRKLSLDAHAAARAATHPAAVAAARAAGQAVATAHVITHAKGAAAYAKLARAKAAHPDGNHKLSDFV